MELVWNVLMWYFIINGVMALMAVLGWNYVKNTEGIKELVDEHGSGSMRVMTFIVFLLLGLPMVLKGIVQSFKI